MSQVNHPSCLHVKKYPTRVRVPEILKNGSRMISPESSPVIESYYIPPPDYEGSAESENVSYLNNFPTARPPSNFLDLQKDFSRNNVCKVSSQTENSRSSGDDFIDYDRVDTYEESSTHQIEYGEDINKPFRFIFPTVLINAKFPTSNDTLFQENRFSIASESEDDSCISYNSEADGCSLYTHCRSPKHQRKRSEDRDCSWFDSRNHVQRKGSLTEFNGMQSPGSSIEQHSESEINYDNKIENSKLPRAQTQITPLFGVNSYPETDYPKVNKGQRKYKINPVFEEYGYSSHCDRDKFGKYKAERLPSTVVQLESHLVDNFNRESNIRAISNQIVSSSKQDPQTTLSASGYLVPVHVSKSFPTTDKKTFHAHPQTSVESKEAAAHSSAPTVLTNSPRWIPSKSTSLEVPLPRYENPVMSERICLQNEFRSTDSSSSSLNPYHAAFLENRNSEFIIQMDDSTPDVYFSDHESVNGSSNYGYQTVNMCESSHRGFKVIPTTTKFSDVRNTFSRDKVLQASIQSQGDNSVSYYSITDGCSLYAFCGSPKRLRNSSVDIDFSLLDPGKLIQKENFRGDFGGVVNLGFSSEPHQLSEIRLSPNVNEGVNVSSFHTSRKIGFDVNPYCVTDLLGNTKEEMNKRCRLHRAYRIFGSSSSIDEAMCSQHTENSKMPHSSEPVYELVDPSYGDSNMLTISMNVPTTTPDPQILLSPSKLLETDPAVQSFTSTDRLDEISSRSWISRCCPCRCKASQFFVWLTIIIFFLAMLSYLSSMDISPESPLVWLFLMPLILTVLFGILKGCHVC